MTDLLRQQTLSESALPSRSTPAIPGSTPSILVVDGDPMVRVLATNYLSQAGFEVKRSATITAAAECLSRSTPDLILLDVILPEWSGLAWCMWLREQPAFEHIPVIVLTAVEDEEVIHEAFDAGATDFLRKPIEAPILLHRVRFALRASQNLRSLKASEATLEEAQRIARMASFDVDMITRTIRHMSPNLRALFGLTPSTRPPTEAEIFARVHREDRERVAETHRAGAVDVSAIDLDLTFRVVTNVGAERWLHERAKYERAADGAPLRMAGTFLDVTERRHSSDQIAYLATHDRATGLLNREAFLQRTDDALATPHDQRGQVAIVQLGLEDSAQVYGRLGPERAARLTRQIADRLAGRSRGDDTPRRGAEALALGRCDGDTFTLLHDGVTSEGDALERAKAAVALLALPFDLGDHQVGVNARAGVALHPTDGTTTDELFRSADTARRSVRTGHRDPVRRHESRLTEEAEQALHLEHDLRAAIRGQQLELHFQPQVDATGAIVSTETLARWHHPLHGWVPPGRFIPIAEEAGLIDDLGRWVIERSTADLAGWKRAGHRIRLAINLSAAQLDDPELLPTIERSIALHGLDGSDLEFEVTESLLISGGDATERTLTALKATGAHLALDDFGTGYSSLSRLSGLPLDVLKIDRSFVDQMHLPGPLAVVRAVISLAHGLDLGVVGEGVETREQADVLLAEGCDVLQGYLYGRPMPADEFQELLTATLRHV